MLGPKIEKMAKCKNIIYYCNQYVLNDIIQ